MIIFYSAPRWHSLCAIISDVVVQKTRLRARDCVVFVSLHWPLFFMGNGWSTWFPLSFHRHVLSRCAMCGNQTENEAGCPGDTSLDVETMTIVSEQTESLSVTVCLLDWLRNCIKRDTNVLTGRSDSCSRAANLWHARDSHALRCVDIFFHSALQ